MLCILLVQEVLSVKIYASVAEKRRIEALQALSNESKVLVCVHHTVPNGNQATPICGKPIAKLKPNGWLCTVHDRELEDSILRQRKVKA